MTGPGEHDHTDLLAYGLGKLDDDEEQAVRDHLATCSAAREEFAELRATAAQIDAGAAGDVPRRRSGRGHTR